jgi:hypothetical protein
MSRIYTALLCLGILVGRAWPRLVRAHLWAEDGMIFLHDALENGASSLWAPYGGYFHALPRLVAFSLSWLPMQAYAFLSSLICFVIYGFVLSEFSGRQYAWIVPSIWWRISACVLMCLSSGLYECLGNLTNLHTGCLIYLCIFAMRQVDSDIKKSSILWVMLCAASEGSAFLLVPAFMARLAILATKHRHCQRQIKQNLVVLGIVATSFVSSNIASVREPVTIANVGREAFVSAFADGPWLILDRFVINPIMGWQLDICLQRNLPHAFWLLSIPVFAVCTYWLIKRRRHLSLLVIIPCMTLVVHYLLMWMVRPGTQELFHKLEIVGPQRHAFASAPMAVIFLFASLQCFPRSKSLLCALYVWLSFTIGVQKFSLGGIKDARDDWQNSANAIQRARTSTLPVVVEVPVAPSGFAFTYRNAAARRDGL